MSSREIWPKDEVQPPTRRRPFWPSSAAAEVERGWAQRSFLGSEAGRIYIRDAHPDGDADGDFHPPPNTTLAMAIDTFWTEAAAADRIYRAADLDDIEQCDRPSTACGGSSFT